ncbi:arginine repressor [Schleiferilactobacillus perolens]|jgi:transcriptional regulator of arginine metabolism|uniref:arginine repressor n=1 Tax=Schleiferilactobacillus perolens TaxID=100468 RepID=UPI0023576428|nr:ArgR family transcriptional regulator [Schleiferilactobacillus perolens]MCI1891343.1 ArgR family transcriptional regulator [Schleiferilactobacillus harbinensis]MCI1912289.1 ArgR family transcriptional regulator [Schleiferilactobacillus harbinensis]MCI2170602.1 ArgR family transcriptional regulator [Schleiferilactobacillus perolens]
MKREERMAAIRQLVTTIRFERQRDLMAALHAKGIMISQGNLSRDIRELGIHKFKDRTGHSYYALSDARTAVLPDALQEAVATQVHSVTPVQFTVVLKTEPGSGNLVAAALDDVTMPEVVGTLAGHDTVLVICPDIDAADRFARTVKFVIDDQALSAEEKD